MSTYTPLLIPTLLNRPTSGPSASTARSPRALPCDAQKSDLLIFPKDQLTD
jgi:hypothetical protein